MASYDVLTLFDDVFPLIERITVLCMHVYGNTNLTEHFQLSNVTFQRFTEQEMDIFFANTQIHIVNNPQPTAALA